MKRGCLTENDTKILNCKNYQGFCEIVNEIDEKYKRRKVNIDFMDKGLYHKYMRSLISMLIRFVNNVAQPGKFV